VALEIVESACTLEDGGVGFGEAVNGAVDACDGDAGEGYCVGGGGCSRGNEPALCGD